MRNKSTKTKQKLKMGTGDGADYKPYLQVGEFGSMGTCSCIVDYKTGRTVHTFSQAEAMMWYILRWDDENLDIKEQYPLPVEETVRIARQNNFAHPFRNGEYSVLTSDFYVKRKDRQFVISIKTDINEKMYKNLLIEKLYWNSIDVPWYLQFKKDINETEFINIKSVVRYYNCTYFPDEITFLKFLIARKLIVVDMKTKLDYQMILKERKDEIERWKTLELCQGTLSL